MRLPVALLPGGSGSTRASRRYDRMASGPRGMRRVPQHPSSIRARPGPASFDDDRHGTPANSIETVPFPDHAPRSFQCRLAALRRPEQPDKQQRRGTSDRSRGCQASERQNGIRQGLAASDRATGSSAASQSQEGWAPDAPARRETPHRGSSHSPVFRRGGGPFRSIDVLRPPPEGRERSGPWGLAPSRSVPPST